MNKNIKIKPNQMTYIIFNQKYHNDIVITGEDEKQAIENHRLIS